ncbi:MAG: leucine-rich repeat domain-containing protein [Clostridia bacterium]|nr:leucine-rich repeat domain-containing protein [Clostridia bacterium]
MKKVKAILSFVFTLGIICLGFSFVSNNLGKDKAYAISYTNNEIVDMINAGECVEKGGAIYLSAGSTYNMSGGEVSGHFAEKGGALYISDGAVFTMTGGTITGNYAKYGGAIYVANGGECYINGGTITGNFAENAPAIYVESGGILEISDNALVDGNDYIKMSPTNINIYVDGTLLKTIAKLGDSYKIDESEMPLDYENCCGYFYDEQLSKCTNGVVNLTVSEEIAFASRRATASSEGINIYTKTASAASNFTFTLNSTTNTYDIKASSTSISGNIVLPKEYNNVQTSIYTGGGSTTGAFYNCTSMTGITFQDGLLSVSNYAFYSCSGLTGTLIIPDSVTSIGNNTFTDCSGLTGELIIPDSVTSIGYIAFQYCSELTSLTIGNGVTSIGNSAFYKCSGLTGELIIPDSVTSIGDYAFYYCSGLTGELIIPDSVTSIGDSAFSYCRGLTSVYIPSSVTSISASSYSYAPFSLCSSSLVIYTDVANASSKPSGWGTYWNYYSSSGTLTVNYGYTLEQYKAAVGLTFAPNGEKIIGAEVEVVEEDKTYQVDNSYLQDVIIEKKEYIVLPKKLQIA